MKIHVTSTYTLTTEHEVDLTGKSTDYEIATILGLMIEHNTHAACDALRGIKSERFRVVGAYGTSEKSKMEIKSMLNEVKTTI